MSMILDALKKSEAERRRGLPPRLDTPYSVPKQRRGMRWTAAIAGVALFTTGLAGAWFWLASGSGDPLLLVNQPGEEAAAAVAQAPASETGNSITTAAEVTPSTAMALATAVPTPVSTGPSTTAVALGAPALADRGGSVSGGGLPIPQRANLYTPTAMPSTAVASANPAPIVEPIAAVPAAIEVPVAPVQELPITEPVAAASTIVAEPPIAVQPVAPAVDALAHSPAHSPAPATAQADLASAKPESLPVMLQLPYGLRKDMPKLDLSMHVYSADRSERFIVLNGKRFSVDSPSPGPELNLVDIVDDGAVLEFRGQRFLLPRSAY